MECRLILLALAAAVASSTAQRAPGEPRPGRLVIDVVAETRSGTFVLDLRPAEFEVWVAGYRVPVESVSLVTGATDQPVRRSITLILDDITVPPPLMPRARDIARQLVGRMSPGDRMAVVMLTGRTIEPTDSPTQLRQAIEAYAPRAVGVMRPDTIAAQVLETLAAVAHDQREAAGRNTIVAIGSAWLFDTPIPPPEIGRDLRREWTAAVRAMADAHATLYVIDPGGVGMSRVTGGTSGFARETGGVAFSNTNDFQRAADRILRDAASYYRLEVVDPPVGRQADLRELDVRVLRRGVSVRARRAVPGLR